VLDHLLKGVLVLDHIRMLIFDEADRMLSMGFLPDMKEIQRYLPRRAINACMFSATFPTYVFHLAHEFIREPEFISLSSDHVHAANTGGTSSTRRPGWTKTARWSHLRNGKSRFCHRSFATERVTYLQDDAAADFSIRDANQRAVFVHPGRRVEDVLGIRGMDVIAAERNELRFANEFVSQVKHVSRKCRRKHAGIDCAAREITLDLFMSGKKPIDSMRSASSKISIRI